MKIRQLRNSDVEEVSKLFSETVIQLTHHYTAEEIRKNNKTYSVRICNHIKDKRFHFKVAEDEGKIVGVMEWAFPAPRMVPTLCWIQWLIVRKSCRRKGVGTCSPKLAKYLIGKYDRIMERKQTKQQAINKSIQEAWLQKGVNTSKTHTKEEWL